MHAAPTWPCHSVVRSTRTPSARERAQDMEYARLMVLAAPLMTEIPSSLEHRLEALCLAAADRIVDLRERMGEP